MNLPIIDPFSPIPFQKWSQRNLSVDEMMEVQRTTGRIAYTANDQLLAEVHTPLEAAHYIVQEGADNSLGAFINNALDAPGAHKVWRDQMPGRTPPGIAKYQSQYPYYDRAAVDAEVHTHGVFLPVGQVLFHGGLWPIGANSMLTTTEPFSTSFCPQVALRNGEHWGKAYNAGEIHLFAVRIENPSVRAFVFRRRGTNQGHENEVLFASGIQLRLINKTLIRNDYPASGGFDTPRIQIPAYVLEVGLS